MVCEDQVGWRDISRRVIIFTTDQSFHIAMDGRKGPVHLDLCKDLMSQEILQENQKEFFFKKIL